MYKNSTAVQGYYSGLQPKKHISAVLRYPGGKARILKEILEFVPSHFEEYREPMVGGGSLFIHMKQMFPTRKYWINDINTDLVSFWISLRDRSTEFVEEIKRIKDECRDGKSLFYKLRYTQPEDMEPFDRGVRFYVLNRISYSGLVDSGGYSQKSFEKRFTDRAVDNLFNFAQFLSGVKITNKSYKEVLTHPGQNVFFFIDPPYERAKPSKLYGKRGINGVNFSPEELFSHLKGCKHKWLLTYDKTETIYNYYAAFAKVNEKSIQYGTNFTGEGKPAKKGDELFIHNYDIEQTKLITDDD